MECARRRLHVARAPHEDDVKDRDDDETGGDRPGRRQARDELRDRDRRKRDERDRCRLRDEPVRLPRDDPQHRGDR